jgi:DNA-binding HxlR family transcriptional regulator
MSDDTKNLFDAPPIERTLARNNDPLPSHEAAEFVAPKLGMLQANVLALVKMRPAHTATELARMFSIGDPRRLNRRLPELERDGLVTRDESGAPCGVTGRKAARWTAVAGKG